ncbi:MAG: hypothetical protein CME16_02080 [Gemmatimonadetes bacterium]|nr:hypothetical protein [Gemmatimonadota bacterium]
MIPFFACFIFLFFLNSCSLIHREQPNEAPILQTSITDTTKVRRGGEVEFEVRASDEDDDPLFYSWNAFGAGLFSDISCVESSGLQCAEITWIAPASIATTGESTSESFLIEVTIRDRQCDIVPDAEARQLCLEEAGEVRETFLIEVVQTPPTLEITPDTTIALSNEPIVLEAFGSDAENDALEYRWEQTEGEATELTTRRLSDNHSQMSFTPVLMGAYRFKVEADDGSAVAAGEILVNVVENADETAED